VTYHRLQLKRILLTYPLSYLQYLDRKYDSRNKGAWWNRRGQRIVADRPRRARYRRRGEVERMPEGGHGRVNAVTSVVDSERESR
jgi:hypothetical protein